MAVLIVRDVMRTARTAIVLVSVVFGVALSAQRRGAPAQAEPNQAERARIAQSELTQAEKDIPKLVPVLELERGMTVADVGAGGGAMTVVLAKWLGPAGRVYATDVAARQLAEIRELVAREHLENVVVLEGRGSIDESARRMLRRHLHAGCLPSLRARRRDEPQPRGGVEAGRPAGHHRFPGTSRHERARWRAGQPRWPWSSGNGRRG
jgi:protein-L-isoaspartate(D-aspartate) O-methyltransferase (PCMT)